jgi:ribosomal protein L16 Arg81 hydroxylase
LGRAEFARGFWSQQPLLSHHAEGFGDLLSAADVDELIAERGIRSPFFRMVNAGESVTGTTRSATAGNQRIADLVDADAVREQYVNGATLILQSLHRIHPALVRFCRALAAELGHPTQCNAYITPPGSQGFAPHHDTHDVFVLQVDGHKCWQVYAPVLTLPLSSQPSQALTGAQPLVAEGTEPVLSVVLGPGDALYLPRGYIHAAETNDDRSIHLTVGVLAATAYDVLRDVLALAADDPEFRRSLPLGSAEAQLAAVAGIVSHAVDWLRELPAERAVEAARSRLTDVAGAEPLGLLAAAQMLHDLDKDTVVRPRQGVTAVLSPAPGADVERVVLRLPDRELSLPAYVGPAVAALLAEPCRVSELDVPVDDALVLVRRLLREGILTRGPR